MSDSRDAAGQGGRKRSRPSSQSQPSGRRTSAAAPAPPLDNPRPTRPLNAYNCFFADQRKKMLQEASESNDGSKARMSFTGMAKEVSQRWKVISAEEKAHYERLAEQDKVRYYREMNEWYRRNNEGDSSENAGSGSSEEGKRQDDGDKKPRAQEPMGRQSAPDPGLVSAQSQEQGVGGLWASQTHLPVADAGSQHSSFPSAALPDPPWSSSGAEAQRMNTADSFAAALAQQSALLQVPGDVHSINASQHIASHAVPPATSTSSAFGPQSLRPPAPAQASSLTPQESHDANVSSSTPAENQALFRLVEGLRQNVRQEPETLVASMPSQQHQQLQRQNPALAAEAAAPMGLLPIYIRPIQQVQSASQGLVLNPQQEQEQSGQSGVMASGLATLLDVSAPSLPSSGEQKVETSAFDSASTGDQGRKESTTITAPAPAPVEIPSSGPPNEPPMSRGQVRNQLNNMIAMLSAQGQDQQQQQQQGQPQQQQGMPQNHPYRHLANNMGDDAVDFFLDAFLDDNNDNKDSSGGGSSQRGA